MASFARTEFEKLGDNVDVTGTIDFYYRATRGRGSSDHAIDGSAW